MVSVKELKKVLAQAIKLRGESVILACASGDIDVHAHNYDLPYATDMRAVWIAATTHMRASLVVHTDGPDRPRDFSVAVKAKELRDALKGHTSKMVTIRHEDRRLTLAGTNGMLNSITCTPVEWPALRVIDQYSMRITDENFVGGLKYCALAMSKDETRFHLCGVLIDSEKRTLVATDGHRLHASEWSEATGYLPEQVIVRDDAVRAACALLHDADVDVSLGNGGWIELSQGGTIVIQTRAIDSKFPPYGQVVPSLGSYTVAACGETKAARKLISAAGKCCGETRGLRITINGKVEYAGDNPDGMAASGTLPWVSSHPADAATVGLNPRYLEESLMIGETANLAISDPLAPVRIDCQDTGVTRYAVIMPMRI